MKRVYNSPHHAIYRMPYYHEKRSNPLRTINPRYPAILSVNAIICIVHCQPLP